jgi:hypothetical protein
MMRDVISVAVGLALAYAAGRGHQGAIQRRHAGRARTPWRLRGQVYDIDNRAFEHEPGRLDADRTYDTLVGTWRDGERREGGER